VFFGNQGSLILDKFEDIVCSRYQGVHEPLVFGAEMRDTLFGEVMDDINGCNSAPEKVGSFSVNSLVAGLYGVIDDESQDRVEAAREIASRVFNMACEAMDRIPDSDFLSELRGCNRFAPYTPVNPVSSFTDDAAYIHGFIKIPQAQLEVTLARSGAAGVFLQSKTADRKPDPCYGVVVMHGLGLEEVTRLTSKISHTLGIVHCSGWR